MEILGTHGVDIGQLKDDYYNESLSELLRNISTKDRIIEFKGHLHQQVDPIFNEPGTNTLLNYRTHYFAPKKNLLGTLVDTFWSNLGVIWAMTLLLYVALYFKWLRIMVVRLGKLGS